MTYNETLNYLYNSLPVFHFQGASAYKPGLDNTIALMEACRHPYKNYKTIHVAGTNGKGSVSHFLAAILQSAGYKVGLYTSPHLVNFGERIKVDGQMIDETYVINFVQSNSALFERIQPSFFEATMAMAFQYFSDNQVDIAIVEVGLGGRLDSTNIITPMLSVITNISFDHVEFLGDTIEKIATEKAGIIKQFVPVVIGESLPESKSVFENTASIKKSNIQFADTEIVVEWLATANFKWEVQTNQYKKYTVGLTGSYQLKNIATVLKAVQVLQQIGLCINEQSIKQGLENVCEITGFWGRWQCFGTQPQLYVDTAHNMAGINELVEYLKLQKFKNLHLVFGMVNDKDISQILLILPKHAEYYFTQASIKRALPAKILHSNATKVGLKGDFFENVHDAVRKAIQNASPEDFILVFGSNFVVGEAIQTIKRTIKK